MSPDLSPDHQRRPTPRADEAAGTQLLRLAFEAAPQAMMLLDRDAVVVLLNGAARALFGAADVSAVGLPCGDVFQCRHARKKGDCGHTVECPRCPVRTRVLETFETGQPVCNAEGQITTICQGQTVVRDLLLSTSLLHVDPSPLVLLTVTDVTELRRAQEASRQVLRESEERWKFALEGANDGVWDWNPLTDEVFFSAQWKSMLGYEEHELRNHLSEWRSRVHPDDLKRVHHDLMQHLSGQTPQYVNEHRLRCKDGSWKWVLDSGKVVRRTADGRPERVIGTHKDISQRKQAEQREAHIKNVLLAIRNINQLITQETDRHQLIEKACRNLTETMGYFSAWIAVLDETGRKVKLATSSGLEEKSSGLRHCLEAGDFPRCMRQALSRPELIVIEAPSVDCPGCPLTQEYADRSALAQRLAFGREVYGVVVVSVPDHLVRDSEEQGLFSEMAGDLGFALRKIADAEALQESEQRFRGLFENALDGVALHEMVLDDQGRPIDYIFLQANPAFEKHTGVRVADILGRRATVVFPGLEKTDLIQTYGRVALTGEPTCFELDFQPSHRYYSVSAYQVGHGRFAAVFEDITERKQAERALKASEEKFAKTFAHAHALMTISKVDDGTFLDVNEAFVRLSGFSREEAIGRTSLELGWISAESRARLREALERHGTVAAMEVTVRTKDGRHLDCLYHGELIDVGGQTRLLSIGVDITERMLHQKEQEAVLAILGLANTHDRTHEFLRAVTSLMQKWSGCEAVGVRLKEGDDFPYFETRGFPPEFVAAENRLCAVDTNGKVLRDAGGNPLLDCMCGNILCGRFDPSKPFFTSRGSFWCNSTSDLLASTSEADRQARTRNRCNGEGYESVALIPLRTGQTTFGLLQFNDPRRDRFTPTLIAMLERLADNIAIALAHCRAQEQLRLQSLVLDQISDSVTVTDLQGNITYVNEAECRAMGRSREELIGRPIAIYGEDAARGATQRQIVETTLAEGRWRGEVINYDANGQEHVMDCRTQVIRDASGAPVALCGIATDVTKRKRLERQYLQAQKMEAVGRLAAGIAHDFNNQLTVVRGYCDLLLAGLQSDDPRWSPLIEIRRAVERSQSTTSHLLSFSRETALRPEIVDLARLLNELRNPVAKMVGEDIHLTITAAADLRPVRIDQAMMQQAIMNLIVNARDAMPAGGELTVRARNIQLTAEEAVHYPGAAVGPYVLLEVIDTGIGMDEETLERIFDPFFTTKDVDKGTGLGLPMVQGFVDQSQGFIRVDSRPHCGTTIAILLPPSEEPVPTPTERPPKTPEVSDRPATILVVEDENSVRQAVIQILRNGGYQVIEAAGPAEALRLVDSYEGKLDLLISDMVMPGMRGTDLAREIQARRGPLRTLFVTGYLSLEQQGQVQNVLMKPFGIAELLARVRQTLDGA